MGPSPDSRLSSRGISPVVGAVLMFVIVLILVSIAGIMMTGFTERLEGDTAVFDRDACPGFQQAELEASGGDFDEFLQALQEDNCALWLRAGDVAEEDGNVSLWRDLGPNEFHATQSDVDQQPRLVDDDELGTEVLSFNASHGTDEKEDFNPGANGTDGDYLALDRDVGELGIDEDAGIAIVAVVKPEAFNRGGVWTVGEAGEDGKEFSMRTCSDYDPEGCNDDNDFNDPVGWWRGQHFGDADVDFDTGNDSEGEWFVLTQAHNGEEFIVRVNGEEIGRNEHGLDLSSNRDIQIGRWERTGDDPKWYFDGRIAEITIFDRTLDQDEIDAIETYMSSEFGVPLDGL